MLKLFPVRLVRKDEQSDEHTKMLEEFGLISSDINDNETDGYVLLDTSNILRCHIANLDDPKTYVYMGDMEHIEELEINMTPRAFLKEIHPNIWKRLLNYIIFAIPK